MSVDYAARLKALQAAVESQRTVMLEARAKVKVLEEQEREFLEKLQAMGVQDSAALDTLIAEARQSIETEMQQISQILESVGTQPQVAASQPAPRTLDALMGR